MSKFIIGDIHGCHRQLMKLIDKLQVTDNDELWFTGDLVSRGPDSLAVLQEIHRFKNARMVLGNHDFHMMYQYYVGRFSEHTHISDERWFADIFASSQAEELLEWIRMQPLIQYDEVDQLLMVHAGIHPLWSVNKSCQLASEVEAQLRSDDFIDLLKNMYGNWPILWQDDLQHYERLRLIINVMTRMRYLTSSYELDFTETGPPSETETKLIPWYQFNRLDKIEIFFGHWASLQGRVHTEQFHNVDGGCVWNGRLIAYDYHNKTIIGVDGYES